ncbi:MAG: serine/threonine protein kinase [Solirubrobacteraceae bacterium]|nr:serine/threonine protein kinase [Solirubrobacteraceae bacterium]
MGNPLGEGGTAAVYEVVDQGMDGAAKVLRDGRFAIGEPMRARFRREIEHLGSLEHPNILRVLDHAEHEGDSILVMERCATSVDRVVRDAETPVRLDRALAWLIQAATGLDHLEQVGLVHRDISLKNLLLRSDGTLTVADFGTVRHLDDATLTVGDPMGSHLFVSPQQYADAHVATPADDVYSLGQVGYYILTGAAPHAAPPSVMTVRRDVPGPLSHLIDGMRAHSATARPSIGSVMVDLVRLVPLLGLEDLDLILGPGSATEEQLERVVEEREFAIRGIDIEGNAQNINPTWVVAREELERARLAHAIAMGKLDQGLVDVYCEYCGVQGTYLAREQLPACNACGRNQLEGLGERAGQGWVRT